MCGIFVYVRKGATKFTTKEINVIKCAGNTIKHRGPDSTVVHHFSVPFEQEYLNICIIFHRLAIVDLSNRGEQPFVTMRNGKQLSLSVCNGEIYNATELRNAVKEQYSILSDSDCEPIGAYYDLYGADATARALIGEFAGIVIKEDGTLFIVRDGPVGVRPLFTARGVVCVHKSVLFKNKKYNLHEQGFPLTDTVRVFSSEYKAIHYLFNSDIINVMQTVEQFPPGNHQTITPSQFDNSNEYTAYRTVSTLLDVSVTPTLTVTDEMMRNINTLLTQAVCDRLISDAPIGFLLSGGLDSSIVVAIARRLLGSNTKLYTFSIGLSDSTDLIAAKQVAEHLGTIHHEVKMTYTDGLNSVASLIEGMETWDQTTVYAGTYQRLLCEWIRNHKDPIINSIKVLLGGELSDEVNCSYRYSKFAPDRETVIKENHRLLEQVHYYDILRGDRTLSMYGFEARVPFSDHRFVSYMLNEVDIDLKRVVVNTPDNATTQEMEKYALRASFDPKKNKDLNEYIYLPDSLLWRRKEAFSDAVGLSWIEQFKNDCNINLTDEQFIEHRDDYIFNGVVPKALTKDELLFRMLYNKFYGSVQLIPSKWVPRWVDTTESSARYLAHNLNQLHSDTDSTLTLTPSTVSPTFSDIINMCDIYSTPTPSAVLLTPTFNVTYSTPTPIVSIVTNTPMVYSDTDSTIPLTPMALLITNMLECSDTDSTITPNVL